MTIQLECGLSLTLQDSRTKDTKVKLEFVHRNSFRSLFLFDLCGGGGVGSVMQNSTCQVNLRSIQLMLRRLRCS